jgi:YidC/Oxa1 family membrane protein insertase
MAEPNTPAPNGPPKPKELSMEIRMVIAFALMGLVMFLTPKFLGPSQPPPAAKKAASTAPATPAAPAPAQAAAAPAAKPAAAAQAKAEVAAQAEQYTVETNFYKIVFSNQGAVVRSWQLKRYKDNSGKLVDLVHAPGAAKFGAPFNFEFAGQKPAADLAQALYVAKVSDDGLGIEFNFSDGRTAARKAFHFVRAQYRFDFQSEVTENGTALPHMIAWRGGFGDATVHNANATERSVHFDGVSGKLEEKEAKAAKDGPVTVSGPFAFAGLQDTYFAAVLLAPPGAAVEHRTFQDLLPVPDSKDEAPNIGAAFGIPAASHFTLFIGPKDMDILKAADPRLLNLVDWGWFFFIAKPLFWALHWVQEVLIPNWGWAIVFITVIINLLMIPLRFSQIRSMEKMQKLQPEIQKINAKYKNVGMRDPRKQQQNQEIMELYQKHGVNPLGGGCLPLVLQMPFFFAFYKVLSVAIELRGASWLWVPDLSQPELSMIRVLPIAMIVTQVVMQKMTPNTTTDPTQQKMMMFMPLMLGFFFYTASSGLVLYWLTGNLVGIAQQYLFNRAAAARASAGKIGDKKK